MGASARTCDLLLRRMGQMRAISAIFAWDQGILTDSSRLECIRSPLSTGLWDANGMQDIREPRSESYGSPVSARK